MTPNLVHLPNGQTLTVLPVFGGFFFRPNELNLHLSAFPAGWTIILQTKENAAHEEGADGPEYRNQGHPAKEDHATHRSFQKPTLNHDSLYLSSISNPPSSDFKAPTSPTRQIAMMLWATFYWYFHLDEPPMYLETEASRNTPAAGKPRGEWRLDVTREGVLRGRSLLPKLERMGLLASDDAAVGTCTQEHDDTAWEGLYITRRTFWQLSPKLFLFTLIPAAHSPLPSRPPSTGQDADDNSSPHRHSSADPNSSSNMTGLWTPTQTDPFQSGSHLPTYFPPAPLQFTTTNGVRHPRRPKAPRQGEIFYTRYLPSVAQYLAFRTASTSPLPVAYLGPQTIAPTSSLPSDSAQGGSLPSAPTPGIVPSLPARSEAIQSSDIDLLHLWMNDPRVSAAWGEQGPREHQASFLASNLRSKHSFPALGLWDGRPFGYFEIYWAKEDGLGRLLGGRIDAFDRGIHVLVGEQAFRGRPRLHAWLTALVHYAFLQDPRTMSVVLEPRVDNTRFIAHLMDMGFAKEGEVTFPHKQSAFMRIRRENFEAPAL